MIHQRDRRPSTSDSDHPMLGVTRQWYFVALKPMAPSRHYRYGRYPRVGNVWLHSGACGALCWGARNDALANLKPPTTTRSGTTGALLLTLGVAPVRSQATGAASLKGPATAIPCNLTMLRAHTDLLRKLPRLMAPAATPLLHVSGSRLEWRPTPWSRCN